VYKKLNRPSGYGRTGERKREDKELLLDESIGDMYMGKIKREHFC
jgi:hypothetical protein